jgi:hypothetical protein
MKYVAKAMAEFPNITYIKGNMIIYKTKIKLKKVHIYLAHEEWCLLGCYAVWLL